MILNLFWFLLWIYGMVSFLLSPPFFFILLGLLSWNALDCHVDLEEELNSLTSHAPEGEAARHGNYLSNSFVVNNVTVCSMYRSQNILFSVQGQFVFSACLTEW